MKVLLVALAAITMLTSSSSNQIEIYSSETAGFEEIEILGTYQVRARGSVEEIMNCLLDATMTIGVTSAEMEDPKKAIIKGEATINDFGEFDDNIIGDITYKYAYIIKPKNIFFQYTAYSHSQGKSDIQSIGVMPLKYKSSITPSLSKKDYNNMVQRIAENGNVRLQLSMNSVENCLKD